MHLRDKLALLFFTSYFIIPAKSFLLPLLFPVSIKITFSSNSKPSHHDDSYHFETVPVYREVVVKGSAHISPASPVKQSYGDGHKYGTSYGDGQLKVYTEEPHIKGHKYASGYGSSGASIGGHFEVSSYPVTSTNHYKGSSYNSGSHYKGEPYPTTHYKGTSGGSYDQGAGYGEIPSVHYKGTTYDGNPPSTHYKGTTYDANPPSTHYKGTQYDDNPPSTHYKGTPYDDNTPSTHYKGTQYDEEIPTHYKGTLYDEATNYYKGSSQSKRPKIVYKNHGYIKAVGGSYKYADYIKNGKTTQYTEDDSPYIAITPGKTYAEIEAAHKAAHSPKAYAAEEYADLGENKYNKEYEHDASYIDDSLPTYKSNIPKPRSRSKLRYEASASRYDKVLPEPPTEKTVYAGFGTSLYGDSYAKIVYVPKSLRISIRAYAHK